VNYSVAANAAVSPRTGAMTIAGQTFTVSEAAAACSYTLSSASQSFGSSGGTNSVGVTAASGCGWTAVSNAGWVSVTSGSPGNGNGPVNYSVAANASSSPRTGTMTIAGQTFTVSEAASSPPPSTYTIWPSTAVPALYESSPPMELGLKFRSDVNGWITGIRFYKNAQNTGVHTGSLWTASGTLLATGTFGGETASGWQQLNLASPAPISANTTYVASFHTNTGFSSDMDYFGANGTDNPPLHAPQGHGWDPNGFYALGSGGIFPNDANSSQRNYWVDVVFTTGP
jgi:hypothetical protein